MKKNTTIKISIATAVLLAGSSVFAGGEIAPAAEPIKVEKKEKPKWKLNGNMTVEYNELPGEVDNITDLFKEGIFYGRLRANMFKWDFGEETEKQQNNYALGVGGSLIYKSASLNGFSGTAAMYTSQNPGFYNMASDEVGFVKAGKDVFSRLKVEQTGDWGMSVIGQAFLEYNNDKFDIIAGRQLYESVFTASNDTKMIPNTFDGVSAEAKVYEKTTVNAAYFSQQKLRDHTTAHDVLTFNTENGEAWGNNDDAAVHKGLSYDKFVEAGQDPDHDLILANVKTEVVKNLKANLSYLSVPDVVQDLVLEGHYTFALENGWAVKPGFRYWEQMDNGGGDIAGYTNLTGKKATGYDLGVANSLDSSLIAARLDFEMPDKKGLVRFGYSKVADEADIIAPWRGFPTDGFTRAMGQYNWFANTETFMLGVDYKVLSDLKLNMKYAIQDFDDAKKNVPADSNVFGLDAIYQMTDEFQLKGRLAIVTEDPGDTGKLDSSYNEYRLEINYLF